jgi:RNA polymerase sigma-70 factor (ECF subfamily)
VWSAIDELTPEERVTVMLRHFTRTSSYAAIAALTGVPVGTVRSRLNRARALLATELEREAAAAFPARSEIERSTRADWRRSTPTYTRSQSRARTGRPTHRTSR